MSVWHYVALNHLMIGDKFVGGVLGTEAVKWPPLLNGGNRCLTAGIGARYPVRMEGGFELDHAHHGRQGFKAGAARSQLKHRSIRSPQPYAVKTNLRASCRRDGAEESRQRNGIGNGETIWSLLATPKTMGWIDAKATVRRTAYGRM